MERGGPGFYSIVQFMWEGEDSEEKDGPRQGETGRMELGGAEHGGEGGVRGWTRHGRGQGKACSRQVGPGRAGRDQAGGVGRGRGKAGRVTDWEETRQGKQGGTRTEKGDAPRVLGTRNGKRELESEGGLK